jgi:SulP family sulfate permease
LLVPKLVTTLRGTTRAQLLSDLAAGVVVGIVALPLAIALAIASGAPPESGLWTAIVGGFLISALGGSRVQIGGPTGAFVVVVHAVLQEHGPAGLAAATMMAGLMLLVLGFARLGAAVKFIPFPVTAGFTSGIALLILSSQVRDLLGLSMEAVPAGFVEQLRAYADRLQTARLAPALVAAGTLAVVVAWPRRLRRVPAPFVALVVATAVVQLAGLPVETIGDRFGQLRSSLPQPSLPRVGAAELQTLLGPAFTIAMLAAIESLLSATVADGMIGGRHRSNMELVAQGVANLATPLVGGLPATGAIARTATNVKNGGRTPIAGIVHALTLLAITLLAGRWAALIPLPALAALLVMVAWHMSGWRTFLSELRAPKSDVAVLLTTFLLTVAVDLTVAVQAGVVLAAFLFLRRMAEVTNVRFVTREIDEADDDEQRYGERVRRRQLPRGVEVFEIQGPFFFGAAEKFRDTLGRVAARPRVLVVRLLEVPVIDSTGLHALRDVVRRSRREGTLVLLSEVGPQPRSALTRSGLAAEIGAENVYDTVEEALERARREAAGGEGS